MKAEAIIKSIEEYQQIESAIQKLHDFDKDIRRTWHRYPADSVAAYCPNVCDDVCSTIFTTIHELEAIRDNLEVN